MDFIRIFIIMFVIYLTLQRWWHKSVIWHKSVTWENRFIFKNKYIDWGLIWYYDLVWNTTLQSTIYMNSHWSLLVWLSDSKFSPCLPFREVRSDIELAIMKFVDAFLSIHVVQTNAIHPNSSRIGPFEAVHNRPTATLLLNHFEAYVLGWPGCIPIDQVMT